MEKLEFEEIAPYLPYGLKGILIRDMQDDFFGLDWVEDLSIFKEGSIWQYAGYADEDLSIPLGEGDFSGFLIRNGSTYTSVGNSVKPILRPLSYLTKEIEVDGEKFIPVNKIIEIFGKSLKHLSTEYQIKALNRFRIDLILGKLEYRYTIKVIEWHFDFNRLIEKGLAIDINTLK